MSSQLSASVAPPPNAHAGALWCALPLELEFERSANGDDLQGLYTPLPSYTTPAFQDPAAAAEMARRGPYRVFITHAPAALQSFLRVTDANVVATTPRRVHTGGPAAGISGGIPSPAQRWYSGVADFWVDGQQLCHSLPTPETPPGTAAQARAAAPAQQQQVPCTPPRAQQPVPPVWQSAAFQQRIVAPSPLRAAMSPILAPSTPTSTAQPAVVQASPVTLTGVCPLPSMQLPPTISLLQHSPQPSSLASVAAQAQQLAAAAAAQQQSLAARAQQQQAAARDGMLTLAEAARSIDRALFSPPIIAGDTAPPALAQPVATARPQSSTPFSAIEEDEAAIRLLSVQSGSAAWEPAAVISSSPARRSTAGRKHPLSSSEDSDEYTEEDEVPSEETTDGDEYAPTSSRRSTGSQKRQRVSLSQALAAAGAIGQQQQQACKGVAKAEALTPICRWKGCGRVFDRVSQLTAHLQTHTMSQSVHRCQWEGCCRSGKPFGNHSGLFRHLRYHTGDKPCKCTFGSCSFSSVDNGELRRHMKLVHRVEMSDLPQPAAQEPSPPQPVPQQSPTSQRLVLSAGSASDRLAPPAFVPMLSLASPQLCPSRPLAFQNMAPPS